MNPLTGMMAMVVCVCAHGAPAALSAAVHREPGNPGESHPHPHPARAAVETLLDRIEVAVLAADQPGYLALIDTEDVVWRHEQIAWAKDLERHKPDLFSLTIDDAPAKDDDKGEAEQPVADKPDSAPASDDAFTSPLKMTWTMPGGGERTQRFQGRFVRRAGQWLYAGEVWNTIEVAPDAARGFHGAVVRYADGLEGPAQRIADGMPKVRSRVDRLFGITVMQPQEVKLYTSMRHLQASIYLSYTDSLGGWNEPGESIKILSGRPASREGGAQAASNAVNSTVAHEYGHVVTFEFGPAITDAPWWVLEGIAEVAAGAASGRGDRRDAGLLLAAERGGLAQFIDLSDFRNTKPKWRGMVYSQGQSMMDFIGRAFGHEARNAFMSRLAAPLAIDEASTQALGLSFAEVDDLWRFWITQRAMFRKADWQGATPTGDADPLGLTSPDAP